MGSDTHSLIRSLIPMMQRFPRSRRCLIPTRPAPHHFWPQPTKEGCRSPATQDRHYINEGFLELMV